MSDNTNANQVATYPNHPGLNPARFAKEDPVKIATPDVRLFNADDLNVQLMEDILFEQIGGQELISIVRSDIINGQDLKIQPIKNLKSLNLKYSPRNIINIPDTSYYFFNNFPISLENYIPDQSAGIQLAEIDNEGNLVINFINIGQDEQIEVQVFAGGNIFDDTIFDDTIYGGES